MRTLSVRDALSAPRAVLLTGATGFLGSVILERLLREGLASTIYVLVRGRKGRSAEHRLRRLLHSGLFHLVRDRPDVLSRVCLIEGDLMAPGGHLGVRAAPPAAPPDLSLSNCSTPAGTLHRIPSRDGLAKLAQAVDVELGHGAAAPSRARAPDTGAWAAGGSGAVVGDCGALAGEAALMVIHCGARIALNDPLQLSLSNYVGTANLLAFMQRLPGVCGLVHVSSAYVNFRHGFLPDGTVEERVYDLCFGRQPVDHRRLVRQVLAMTPDEAEGRCHYLCDLWGFPNSYVLGKALTEGLVRDAAAAGLPTAIVRPSLIGALVGQPYPGFVGNLAGPGGFAVAHALGFFIKHATAYTAWNHMDCVPVDVVASVCLAAGAGLVAGYAPPATVAAAAAADERGGSGGVNDNGAPRPLSLAVYHAATSTLNPCCYYEALAMANRFSDTYPPRFSLGRNMRDLRSATEYKPVPWRSRMALGWLGVKVWSAARLLQCFGHAPAARQLEYGFLQWRQAQEPRLDARVWFDMRNLLALEAQIVEDELAAFPLTWRDDWQPYAWTYMAAVMKLYLHQDIPRAPLDHGFVHIPDRRVE